MELKEAFIQAVIEVFPLFGMKPQFKQEADEGYLSAADQISILCSLSHTVKGNIVFGFSKNRALNVATLIKGKEVTALDPEAKNAIGEMINLVINLALSKFKAINAIYISPPMLVMGESVSMMISRAKTTKLIFELSGEIITVTYCIEESSDAF